MHTFFKKLFLFYFLFLASTQLFADTTKVQVLNAPTVNENDGSTNFTIKLKDDDSVDWCDTLRVDYTTINGSAHSPSDYTAKTGHVDFSGWCILSSATPSSQTVSVNIQDDTEYENTEQFYLKITGVSSGYGIDSHHKKAYAKINDDDTQPLILNSFNDKGITESDSTQTLSMVAYFNQTLTSDVTVNFHTIDGTATAGNDYVAISNGSVVATSGTDRAIMPITIIGDTTPENTETFQVVIDSISVGTITDNVATATIYDDDAIEVDVSCSDTQEGALGESNNVVCRIFLTKDFPVGSTAFTVDYTSADGSSPSAIAGNDYTAVSGTVNFQEGVSEHIVNIPTIGDDNVEPDENVKLVLSNSPYIIDFESEAEILNDDGDFPSIDFSTADVSIIEGNASTKMLNFHFTLDADAVEGSSFEYYTQDDDAKTSDNDYVEINSTKYIIPVGTRDIDINVIINGDTKIETDETFYLKFKNEENLTISGHTAKANILNDDGSYPLLTFDLASYAISEGDSGTQDLNFTLSLSEPAIAGSSFDYYTTDGTATTANSDYNAIPNTKYTFIGGERNITIPVQINGDTDIENDETFSLVIDNEHNLSISGTQSPTGTILNNDASHLITNIGEFRFDDCGAEEWKIDSSPTRNDVISGSPKVISNDGKTYMCTSLNGYGRAVATIPHHSAYEVDSGTFSVLLYDHHNIWAANSWLFQKGAFKIEVVRVAGDPHKGSIKVYLDGNIIDTQEVFFTNSNGGNLDTQWIHVAVTFGANGMKLYINGVEKGSNPYMGGISAINNKITMATLSGYFDEFYMFKGQMTTAEVEKLYDNLINNINIDGTPRDCGCHLPSDPFTCDSNMYISSSINRETGTTGKMWLHRIDTATNPFEFKVIEPIGESKKYNATAFNPNDRYIYGLYHRELIKITRDGHTVNLGKIIGLPSKFDHNQLFAGAIYNNFYYVGGRNNPKREIYKIDLNDFNKTSGVTEVNLTQAVNLQDFAFYKNINDPLSIDGVFLYGFDKSSNKLTKIDVRNGTVTKIGAIHTNYEFDSAFSDQNGRFFANDSDGKGFFEFNLNDGTKRFLSNSQPATKNDGANCINASLVFTDYGDAPSSYGTPRHNIANEIYMGNEVDHDIQAYSSVNADGDDLNGIDDEDGVILADGSDLNGSFFAPNTLQELNITVSKTGYLNVWIDYNLDGDFNDVGEKIFSAKSLTAGGHTLSFTTPNALTTNQTSYIRFRYSSTANLNATQSANDGEVEDYAIKFGTDALTGKFNIERTNSGSYPLMSNARNAWYTQIVGRDFDYSLVFYEEDFSAEQNLTNVTVRVNLMDMDTNSSLYQYNYYFPDNYVGSRKSFTLPHDLDGLPATKNARFKVTYAVDGGGSVVQANCATTPALCTNHRSDKAKDNFAIRPDYYYMTILDNGNPIRVNTHDNNTSLRVSAGYDYNLRVVAHDNNGLTSRGYTINSVKRVVEFLDKSNANAPVKDDYNATDSFIDGNNTNTLLEIPEVGNYRLSMIDTLWTKVDSDKDDCIENNSTKSVNGNIKSGCDIVSPDINLSSYPDHFAIDLAVENLPNSTHNDFIYMSPMSINDNNVSISFEGNITAQNADNNTTQNFTTGYFSQNVALDLNTTTLSDTGTDTPLMTSDGATPVNFARTIEFNNDGVIIIEQNPSLNNLPLINIDADKFTNEHNGTANMDIRYNIDKNISKPINPIQITFHGTDADSADSYSIAQEQENPAYIPTGHQDLNTTKNFYFAKVTPDKINYPRVNMNISPLVRTPLSVDIFCDRNTTYCTTTGVIANTEVSGTTREQAGWYLSTSHEGNIDGNVTGLNPNFANVNLSPNPTLLNPLSLPAGHNGTESATFPNCVNNRIIVTIVTDPVLDFQPNTYALNCTDNNASQWTGVGQTGNILEVKPTVNKTGKMDW